MRISFRTYWRGVASGSQNSLFDRMIMALLIPLALPYSLILQLRGALYQAGIFRTRRLPVPVISIGNITVGGTGKTPVTAYIAQSLISKGVKVAVLSRGYGGSMEGRSAVVSDGQTIRLKADECGDEPFLLASTIPGLMVIIGANRYEAGEVAIKELSPDIFLLDDGFQHLALHRDLNILLLDYTRPFGNGWTLPAGLLREPRSSTRRADLIIQTRSPEKAASKIAVPDKTTCLARHQLIDVYPLNGGTSQEFSNLANLKIIAFAGIAEPDVFFNGLKAEGLNIVSSIAFSDHARYSNNQLEEIASLIQTSDADFAITTEKDGVKLTHLPMELKNKILLARLNLTIDAPAPLERETA